MIKNLKIQNVALIDEAEVEFGEGLNILTGETGAGKSILIDSISFLLGGRAGKDFIRSGEETALVEGIISLEDPELRQLLEEMDIEIDETEEELLISRNMQATGRSTCRINGRSVTARMLKDVCANLIDIHGQHQHQSLLDANKHIVLLDRFCGEELEILKENLSEQISEYREIAKVLKSLQGAPGQREAQLEIWQFQIDEISQANLKLGEEEELTQNRNKLSAVDKLAKNASEALKELYGGTFDSSATERVGRALSLVAELARFDEGKQALADKMQEMSVALADVVEELSDYVDGLDADPHTLERLESRLDIIYRLKKKYGGSVEDVLAHLDKVTEQYNRYNDTEAEIATLTAKRREYMQVIAQKCNEMTALRRKQSDLIQGRIVESLQELGMKNVQFEISIEKQAAFSANGNDKLEFMISPNLGEPLKPLAQIASGGEMSRVMLALKAVMAEVDGIGTLIFDEIDAGVSGRTAQMVAEKLSQIANTRQILCITHLPQIAAMADTHFLISKGERQGATITSVQMLGHMDEIQELARLIGGALITNSTVVAAEEMKDMAKKMTNKTLNRGTNKANVKNIQDFESDLASSKLDALIKTLKG